MKEVIRNLKPYGQREDGTCGQASLVMMYRAFRITTEEHALIGEMHPDLGMLDSKYSGGTLHEQMAESAKRHGFTVWQTEHFTYEGLTFLTQKGLPVIVEWMTDLNGTEESDCHYSVVVEAKNNAVKMADPSEGEWRTMDRQNFERKWMSFERDGSTTHRWAMVLLPK